jgi:hypothetical protein
MLVELKHPQHDRVAEPGGNHGIAPEKGTDGAETGGRMAGNLEIAFAATLS